MVTRGTGPSISSMMIEVTDWSPSLYYIVGEKQFTTIKFKNCEGAWHQVTNPGALREIKMSVVAAAEAYGADVYTQSGTLATCLLLQLR